MANQVHARQLRSGVLEVRVPMPHTDYLDALARRNCWPDLWDLFRHAAAPLKEMSESYSAYRHLRPWRKAEGVTVVHVGDGAHCRTAALFALMTKHDNISVDPQVRTDLVGDWQERHEIVRFHWFAGKWQDYPFAELAGRPVLFTFVHAHVDSWAVVQHAMSVGVDVLGAYVSACCVPAQQLTLPVAQHDDWGILSPNRTCQVWGAPVSAES